MKTQKYSEHSLKKDTNKYLMKFKQFDIGTRIIEQGTKIIYK